MTLHEKQTEFIQAVSKYKREKLKIQLRQKAELKEELSEEAAEVGRIVEELRKHMSMEDVATLIGMRGKMFLYEMRKAYKLSLGLPEEEDDQEQLDEKPYAWLREDEFSVTVWHKGQQYHLGTEDNIVTETPDEWATASREDRLVFRAIIQEVESGTEA